MTKTAVVYTDKTVRCASTDEEWDALPQFGIALVVSSEGIAAPGEMYRLQNGRPIGFNDAHAFLQMRLGPGVYESPYSKCAELGVKFGAQVDEGWEEIRQIAQDIAVKGCKCQ